MGLSLADLIRFFSKYVKLNTGHPRPGEGRIRGKDKRRHRKALARNGNLKILF